MRAIGEGPAVVLVHGDVGPGPTWKAQEELRARWRLLILSRRGFRPSPPTARQDFAVDARDIETLLGREPAHCVGSGYGAVGLALAACRVPERVRSLTLIEPPITADPASRAETTPSDRAPRPVPEAAPDLAAVRHASVPALVLTGGHDPAVEHACDELAEALGARRERAEGAGAAVQRAAGFNALLERFLFAAERT